MREDLSQQQRRVFNQSSLFHLSVAVVLLIAGTILGLFDRKSLLQWLLLCLLFGLPLRPGPPFIISHHLFLVVRLERELLQSIQSQLYYMIYLLCENLKVFPFIFIPELSPQVLNDELAVDVLYIEFAHCYLLLLLPFENQFIGLDLCYLWSTQLVRFLLSSLRSLLHYIPSFYYWLPSFILLIRWNVVILPEVVKLIETSNKCFYLSIEKGYFLLFNYAISIVVASHYFVEDFSELYVLLTKEPIRWSNPM